MAGNRRGRIAPEADERTIAYRVEYPFNTQPRFDRSLPLYSYTPPACTPPPEPTNELVSPPTTPLSLYCQGQYVSRIPPVGGASLRAADALALLQGGDVNVTRRVGAPGLRWRARWHDGALGHELVADCKAGAAFVIPATTNAQVDLLISGSLNEAAVSSKGEDLDVPVAPIQTDNIQVAVVAAGATYPQPNNYPEGLTLTDWMQLSGVAQGADQFVPVPAYARRLRWDFGPAFPLFPPLGVVTARWVQFEGPPLVFGSPVDVNEDVDVPGNVQGIMFSSGPGVDANNIDCVWSLQL